MTPADFHRAVLYTVSLIALFIAIMAYHGARARDDGQWTNQPPDIRKWFSTVMQPENPRQSCCGEGDAFEVALKGDNPDTSIHVAIVNGRGVIPDGFEIDVPRSKLQPNYGNPLDHYILFIGANGRLLCLIPKIGA